MCIYRKILTLCLVFFLASCTDFNKHYKRELVISRGYGIEERVNSFGQPVHIYCQDCVGPTKKTPVYLLNKASVTAKKKSVQISKNKIEGKKNHQMPDRLGAIITPIAENSDDAPISPYKQGRSFGSAFFDVNSSALSATSRSMLDEVVTFYNNHPSYAIRVSGYSDPSGPLSGNQQLAAERAVSIIEYLVSNGIDKKRINNLSNSKFAGNGVGERRADATQGGELIFIGFDKNSNRLSDSAIDSLNNFVSSRANTAHYWLRGVIDSDTNSSHDKAKLDHKSVDLAWAVRMHLIGLGVNREQIRILRRQPQRLGWRVDVESLGDSHPLILSKI